MAVKDLAEGMAPSETWVSVWWDDESQEVYVQYGYVDISMPAEDFHDLVNVLTAAQNRLRSDRRR